MALAHVAVAQASEEGGSEQEQSIFSRPYQGDRKLSLFVGHPTKSRLFPAGYPESADSFNISAGGAVPGTTSDEHVGGLIALTLSLGPLSDVVPDLQPSAEGK